MPQQSPKPRTNVERAFEQPTTNEGVLTTDERPATRSRRSPHERGDSTGETNTRPTDDDERLIDETEDRE